MGILNSRWGVVSVFVSVCVCACLCQSDGGELFLIRYTGNPKYYYYIVRCSEPACNEELRTIEARGNDDEIKKHTKSLGWFVPCNRIRSRTKTRRGKWYNTLCPKHAAGKEFMNE